jgi:hypothetical protein
MTGADITNSIKARTLDAIDRIGEDLIKQVLGEDDSGISCKLADIKCIVTRIDQLKERILADA